MFNFLSKPLILILFVSLSLNGLFGYLSYHFYGTRAQALASLEAALEANKSLEESYEKQDTACKITDAIVSEYAKEKQEIVKEKDSVLSAINKLPSMPTQAESSPKRQENAKEQIEDAPVSLDAKLGDDIKRVLSEVCLRAKGSACDDT